MLDPSSRSHGSQIQLQVGFVASSRPPPLQAATGCKKSPPAITAYAQNGQPDFNISNARRRNLLLVGISLCLSKTEAAALGAAPRNLAEEKLIKQNQRIQKLNNVPDNFPVFVREGFNVKVVVNSNYVTLENGLVYWDVEKGDGDQPKDGQELVFDYIGYNESGRRIDSTYQQGRPARVRLGVKGLVPGFEEGIKTMKAGGKRRIIVPPELGPPVGPSTFFSSKQFEVFDVELHRINDCVRKSMGFISNLVCE